MPALLELGPAVVALLILLAVYLLVLLAQNLIPNLPIIGSALRDIVVSSLRDAINGIWWFLKAIVRPILDVLWRVQVWNMRLLGWGLNALERVPAAIAQTATVVWNRTVGLYNNAINYAAQAANAANGYAYSLYANAIGYANSLYNSATNYAASLYNSAIGFAQSVYANATNYAAQLYNQAIGYANGIAATAQAEAQAAVTHADNLFTTAEADVGRLAGTVQVDISNAIRTAEGYADGAAQAAAAVASAGVLAKVLPMIGTLTTEAETCLKPLCDTVTPNAPQLGRLGSILQDMETLITDGSMLALVVYLLTQQRQAAQDITAVVGDIVAPIINDAKALL